MDESRKKKVKKTSQFAEIWHRLKKNKMAMAGLYILLFILVASLFGPLISIYQYDVQDYAVRSQFPSLSHLFGTDNFGRDIFMGIPTMMLCVSIVAALGSSMRNMMIALIVTQSPEFARIMRAQVLTVKDKEYIEAARSIGCSNARIIFSHIVPNVLAPIIVQYTLGAVNVILMSASLSFVGMGVQPPTPEWGLMISAGRDYLRDYWHIAIIPGLAIVVSAFALNMLGDGLRDALDPRLKQ